MYSTARWCRTLYSIMYSTARWCLTWSITWMVWAPGGTLKQKSPFPSTEVDIDLVATDAPSVCKIILRPFNCNNTRQDKATQDSLRYKENNFIMYDSIHVQFNSCLP